MDVNIASIVIGVKLTNINICIVLYTVSQKRGVQKAPLFLSFIKQLLLKIRTE